MKHTRLQGYKGSKQQNPIEVEDTIQSTGKAYIVDLLCEGEIEDMVALYIDEAKYTSSDFPTVTFDKATMFRRGLPRTSQSILSERYAGAKVPLPIPQSSKLRSTRPITLYFNSNTYPDATSVLVNVRMPSMMRQVSAETKGYGETAGDIRETTVQYSVTLTENGVDRAPIVEVIREKSTGGFIWSTRVNLSPDPSKAVNRWKLKIHRTTPDSTNTKISNDTFLDSVIVETSYNYNYPNTAIAAIAFDAKDYPTVGQRAYDLKLRKVRVPQGYTPTQYDEDGNVTSQASYPAIWNGTFSATKVWTDNPAWIFYDLLTDRRTGLGEFISGDTVDKWTLYSIAKYCDELIDKGNGEAGLKGLEPRFACNLFLTTQEEAYTVVNNLASVFRGITYWMTGKIFPVQDRPKNQVQLFTNANVLNGMFTYSSTGKNQRRTVCQVRWNDPQNFYRPQVEYVEDTEGVIKFGIRSFDVGAFACTSRGQAYRVGKWSLLSERLETEIVNFDTGMEGIYSRPGDVIEIYDDFRIRQKQGGRTVAMNGARTQVTLDRLAETGDFSYKLSLSIPKTNRDPAYTGSDSNVYVTSSNHIDDIRKSFIETRDVSNMYYAGDSTVVDVTSAYSEVYIGGSWSLEAHHSTSGKVYGTKSYRILNIKENEEKNLAITALEYDSSKFSLAETGFTVRIAPTTDYNAAPLNPPSNLVLTPVYNYSTESFAATIEASWTPSPGEFISHHVASGRSIAATTWSALQVYDNGSKARYVPYATGTHEIIVAAVQVGGLISSPISSSLVIGASNPLGNDVIPVSGIQLLNADAGSTNQYSVSEPIFEVVLQPSGADGRDLRRAFLVGSEFRFKNAVGTVVSNWAPSEEGEQISIGQTGVNITGWPFRTGIIEARAVDYWENTSPSKSLTFANPAPPTAGLTVISKTNNSFQYMLEPHAPTPSDYSGTLFWTSTTNVFPSFSSYLTKNGMAGEITHNLNADNVYVWYALADNFSFNGLNINGPVNLETGPISTPSTTQTLTLSGHLDSWNNEHYTLFATWNRFEVFGLRDYYVYLQDNSGNNYTYIAPQTDSGVNPYFHFDSVIPDRTYKFQIKGRNGEGRTTSLSAFSNSVTVPKPKIRFLQVEGKSYFFEPTYVKVHSQTISSSESVDYSKANILKVNLTNAGAITLGATGIQSGSTYLIYLLRQANAGAVIFSTDYKWPEGEPIDLSSSTNAVDVISAFAIDSNTLYAVGVTNMS